MAAWPTQRIWLAFLAIIACLPSLLAVSTNSTSSSSASDGIQYIPYTNSDGQTVYLDNDRQPSLYTGNYGDCLGNSLINFTRFDAAYYHDNMTVLFHLEGNTAVANESLMLYISVFAYGETRFTFIFNPCAANIPSLCPLNASVPIVAQGIIQATDAEVAAVPALALNIPDFEGQAVLRVFANSTQSEIGCYSAVLTNGKSFSHPGSVGAVLGAFALVAMCASFATAIYGGAVPTLRLHYAHSLSTGVVFAVFQHIFFTGALSMNWPPVLVAWWSNFAWAGGMINVASMQNSINRLVGNNIGSTAEVGAAPSDSTQNNVGGTPDIAQIYKRSAPWGMGVYKAHASQVLVRRGTMPPLDGYTWYGEPVGPGLPLPGNYSGFAGTLAEENIPVSNAFMTGFLWILILLGLVMAAVVVFKGCVEFLALLKLVNKDRLRFFRDHWLGYTAAVGLRTCYLAWFAVMFLTIFEFTFSSSGGVKGVAAVAFVIFFVGLVGAAIYACYYKLRVIDANSERPSERKKLLGMLPWKTTGTVNNSHVDNIHDNEDFTKKFGWLASRFRRTKWWFFTAWLVYEFLRACFYAGASGKPLVQVFGLLVIEFLAFVFIIWARPFEGRRLNILVVYCLGFSKVASVALSAAFDTYFNLNRITTTVVGIVIIVIQGVLAVLTLFAIAVGAVSSYMSVARNRDDFRPRRLAGVRERYFNHLDRTVEDVPQPPKPETQRIRRVPKSEKRAAEAAEAAARPYFEMRSVKRVAKIEDEDDEISAVPNLDETTEIGVALSTAEGPTSPLCKSRPGSLRSVRSAQSSLPFGAHQQRPSWSSHDLAAMRAAGGVPPLPSGNPLVSSPSTTNTPGHVRSRSHSSHHRLSARRTPPPSSPRQQPPPPIPPLRQTQSATSLRVGGDMSTQTTIGTVLAPPATRPRTAGAAPGTLSRASSSRASSLTSLVEAPDLSGAGAGGDVQNPRPLTPAQELDEWPVGPVHESARTEG